LTPLSGVARLLPLPESRDERLANTAIHPCGARAYEVRDSPHKHERKSFAGRYGMGLPRINDGSFLFLQHMISKMRPPEQGGSRLAIVFNGSPLFTGAAGSGESEIRRWIIENDWLEAVVALPGQLFYNTGISTYFWIVTNRKSPNRKGKVQLIDARQSFTKMRKSLGEKRKEVSADQIADTVRLYGNFDQQLTDDDEQRIKIFPNEAFGFLRITVERPLKLKWEVTDASADALLADKKLAKLDEQQRQALAEHARGRVARRSSARPPLAERHRLAVMPFPPRSEGRCVVSDESLNALELLRPTIRKPVVERFARFERDSQLDMRVRLDPDVHVRRWVVVGVDAQDHSSRELHSVGGQ